MQFERVIKDLLFSTDCLVIPQFGGLVAKHKSAALNSQLHTVFPPCKTFGFNPNIKESDGLLISVVSQLKSIRFDEAKLEVENWVSNFRYRLSQGEKIQWDGIGIFYTDNSGLLQFIPNQQSNFLFDTQYFQKIVLTPIQREDIVPLSEASPEQPAAPIKWIWRAAAVLALPILGVGIFAISEKIQQTDWKYASFKLFGTKSRIADFSPQSENRKTISWEMAEDHIETAKQSESSSPITSDTPVIDNSIKTNSKPDTEFSGAEKEYKYDIIVGAFSVNSNALNYVKTLKSKGYNAYLAGKGKNGLLMVAVNGSDNQNQAIQTLDSVKIELNPQAWINQN